MKLARGSLCRDDGKRREFCDFYGTDRFVDRQYLKFLLIRHFRVAKPQLAEPMNICE